MPRVAKTTPNKYANVTQTATQRTGRIRRTNGGVVEGAGENKWQTLTENNLNTSRKWNLISGVDSIS